jgi:hypothetical protein
VESIQGRPGPSSRGGAYSLRSPTGLEMSVADAQANPAYLVELQWKTYRADQARRTSQTAPSGASKH